MKSSVNNKGYKTICLREDGVQYTRKVANLVADAFIEEDRDGRDVTYKDGDRANVRASNLEYLSRSDISRRAFERGTRTSNNTSKKIRDVVTGEIYDSVAACSRATGLGKASISRSADGSCAYLKSGHRFEPVD